MTRTDIQDLLARHKEAFAERDPEALAADHAPDGTFESPASGLVSGRAAIEQVYRYWMTAFPDLLLTWDDALIDGDRATFFWTMTGTASGPFYGIVGAGGKIHATGAASYRFNDEGILSARHVFDWTAVLLATGVLKARPA